MRSEKQREYDRAYYARNREKVIARKVAQAMKNKDATYLRNAAWRAANPEKVRAKDRAYYAANRERIAKRVSEANKMHRKLRDDVYFRRLEKRALLCQRKKDFLDQYKRERPCSCGESDVDCLTFHHIDGRTKEYNVANMKGRYSLERIKEEVVKCVVMCENCHRKLHARMRREASDSRKRLDPHNAASR